MPSHGCEPRGGGRETGTGVFGRVPHRTLLLRKRIIDVERNHFELTICSNRVMASSIRFWLSSSKSAWREWVRGRGCRAKDKEGVGGLCRRAKVCQGEVWMGERGCASQSATQTALADRALERRTVCSTLQPRHLAKRHPNATQTQPPTYPQQAPSTAR